MKTFYRTNQISTPYEVALFAAQNLDSVSRTVIDMYRRLYPEAEVYISINTSEETDTFMKNNIHYEIIKQNGDVDGFLTNQFLKDDSVYLDKIYLREISKLAGDKHLIIGPAFSKIPSFLHSKTVEELIEENISGIMYDTRDLDFHDFKALQPLAKLRSFARNRIEIIPVVSTIEKRDELLKLIPFNATAII
ncbi:hypothetical protein GCM10007358_01240 [Phocicoccus schoeneichii]|uniref:Uncharacterized protein n=1 Tax=Phocicoccus schoeneichii TaxID=1812261 RepID=A0A6V7RKH4_9BACL|nr:hypothetical protein [Jeotgalicoccus schoeneichii]GGH46783.1 hypothetical protein GCM10007358_01240 [Jeotgalicoccus schoeneichii]CAD2077982.1 hypothetical protein JEOSCH030_01430 [Jeotgalicoccus schoeneichii]